MLTLASRCHTPFVEATDASVSIVMLIAWLYNLFLPPVSINTSQIRIPSLHLALPVPYVSCLVTIVVSIRLPECDMAPCYPCTSLLSRSSCADIRDATLEEFVLEVEMVHPGW